jgi:hypothetical protein
MRIAAEKYDTEPITDSRKLGDDEHGLGEKDTAGVERVLSAGDRH